MRIRPVLRVWHKWFGILCGVWLMLLAVTGSAIAWYDEIDIALNADLRRVQPADDGPSVPLDRVRENAQAALPGFDVGYILLAPTPDASHWLLGRQVDADGAGRAMQIFADPASGEILGWRESGALVFDRRHLPDILYALHTELLLHDVGIVLVGFLGIAWLIDHLLALPLAIPRMRQWRAAFAIEGRRGSLRRLWDWHRAKGMWLWPLTFLLALTGVTLTFPEESRDVVRLASPVGERVHDRMEPGTPPVDLTGLDGAIAASGFPLEAVHSIRPFPEVGLYAIRTHHPHDLDDQARLWTYVRMKDGTVFTRRHDNGETAGDGFFALQYPLHSGRIAGTPGQIVVTLAGLATTALCISGMMLVIRRRRRHPDSPARTAPPQD